MASAQSTPFGFALPGMIELDLGVVDLTGADAREWLQGQVTQDLRGLVPGGSTRACLCKPTGQLLAHLEIWTLAERLRLLIHRVELPAFLTRVEEAVIMEDVEATVVPRRVLHSYGGPASLLRHDWAEDLDGIRPRDRTGLGGHDALSAPGHITPSYEEALERINLARAGQGLDALDPANVKKWFGPEAQARERERFAALTLARGEPIPGVDTTEKTLPPELGPAFEAATISYRKGCYTGQEVLMRLHSRGHTNRTWRGLISPILLTAGAKVFADGAEVGRVTRAETHPLLGPIAAAFLRHEAEGKAITVETPGGTTAVRVGDLPLSTE